MIVAVKRKDPKKIVIKVISIIAVIAMFSAYYSHMSDEFSQDDKKKNSATQTKNEQTTEKQKARAIERLIYKEVEIAVDLIGQEYVQKVKVIGKKILVTCDANTNLEPLMVRYGTMALTKNSINNIKIAIDLKYIVENKYNEK